VDDLDRCSPAVVVEVIEASGWATSAGLDNPREIKRFINLYRFYSFVLFGRRQSIEPAATAKLAILALRWPFLIGRLSRVLDEGESVLSVLERLVNKSDWPKILADYHIVLPDGGAEELRTLLQREPSIAELVRQVL
jgi:hypothetical protein